MSPEMSNSRIINFIGYQIAVSFSPSSLKFSTLQEPLNQSLRNLFSASFGANSNSFVSKPFCEERCCVICSDAQKLKGLIENDYVFGELLSDKYAVSVMFLVTGKLNLLYFFFCPHKLVQLWQLNTQAHRKLTFTESDRLSTSVLSTLAATPKGFQIAVVPS